VKATFHPTWKIFLWTRSVEPDNTTPRVIFARNTNTSKPNLVGHHGKLGVERSPTYGNKDVNATKKCIAKPHQAVDEVKEGEQERHVFHTPGPDHQPLQKAR
jgi:hypothetical protein